jgi:phosphoenolpyruvate phosphomutase
MRELLLSPSLAYLMEAHDGLSARIVNESGFDGIWVSGLAVSTVLGLRDCNEASSTQLLAAVEAIADSTSLPILVDGDSGFGDFNNVRLVVRKMSARGVGGLCIEDKEFPKRNSFMAADHRLVSIEEFCGKLKAAKDSARRDDFCVVARTEALITGTGMDDALRRARAYAAAGADAIVIHSKSSNPGEVLRFASAWSGAAPLILIPTTYSCITEKELAETGASIVIWANHMLRASLAAMLRACREIRRDGVARAEAWIAPVRDIFRLLQYDELADAERRYLPEPYHGNRRLKAIATLFARDRASVRRAGSSRSASRRVTEDRGVFDV